MKFLDYLCYNFGYENFSDFSGSFIHSKLFILTLPLTGLGVVLEYYLGFNMLTLMAFGVLIFLELLTGLISSRIKGAKIQSRKFSRFGLKLFVWVTLFFITNSMKLQYSDTKGLSYEFYDWLHTFILGFVNMEYLISVLENLGVITGKSNNTLIGAIKKKFFKITGIDGDSCSPE